ncbi:MAG: hypothetical protein WDM76_11095 [Limisphaerales bacterium]
MNLLDMNTEWKPAADTVSALVTSHPGLQDTRTDVSGAADCLKDVIVERVN